MADFSLSYTDLVLVDGFIAAARADDKEALNQILYTNGLDVAKPYTMERRLHRNLQNKVVDHLRFEGKERLDDEWIKGGAASRYAIIESCNDDEMRRDLVNMGRDSVADRAWNKDSWED